MPYSPNVWKDGFDGRTPITAAALTKIEEGIRAASAAADSTMASHDETKRQTQALSAKVGGLENLIRTIRDQLVPIGTVVAYAGQTIPDGWLFCYGQAVKRRDYPELFNALGTTAGSGDGSTTFNIPDWRGKVTYGQGGDGLMLPNVTVGEKEHALTVNEMPSHGHEIVDSNNGNNRWKAAAAGQDIGINGNGYTYATSAGTTVEDRRPYANYVGGNQPFKMRPYGITAYMIIRAK